MPVDLLPGGVYTVAADLCLQPCRKEPLLKTNGITFQRSWCQELENRATFDTVTQFNPADAPQVGDGRGACPPTGVHLGHVSAVPGKPNTVTNWSPATVQGIVCTYLKYGLWSLLSSSTTHCVVTEFFLMHPKFKFFFFFPICVLCKPAKPQCVPPLEKLTLS